MEIQKTEQESKKLEIYSQELRSARLTPEAALNALNIAQIKKIYSEDAVIVLAIDLVSESMKLFNAKQKMTDEQIEFFVIEFLNDYKFESLEDLAICLRNGAKGKYGKTFNAIDPMLVFQWFEIYLEEKSQAREQRHKAEKAKHNSGVYDFKGDKEAAKHYGALIRQELAEKKARKEAEQYEMRQAPPETKEQFTKLLREQAGLLSLEALERLERKLLNQAMNAEEIYKEELEILRDEKATR